MKTRTEIIESIARKNYIETLESAYAAGVDAYYADEKRFRKISEVQR